MSDVEQILLNKRLVEVVKEGDISTVNTLLAAGAEINHHIKNTNLLIIAYDNNNLEMMQYLLDKGAKPISDNKANIFTHILFYLPTISSRYPYNVFTSCIYDKYTKWLKSYDTQKFIIDKYPETLKYFINLKIINVDIEKEYQHLLLALQLNIL